MARGDAGAPGEPGKGDSDGLPHEYVVTEWRQGSPDVLRALLQRHLKETDDPFFELPVDAKRADHESGYPFHGCRGR